MSTSSSFISDLVLPTATSHLVRETTGRFAIRLQHHPDSRSPNKILARVGTCQLATDRTHGTVWLSQAEAQYLSLRLDTVLKVVVEPRPGSCLTPASSTSPQHPLLLSDGDCLHFTDHYLKILYTAQQQTVGALLPDAVWSSMD